MTARLAPPRRSSIIVTQIQTITDITYAPWPPQPVNIPYPSGLSAIWTLWSVSNGCVIDENRKIMGKRVCIPL